MAKILVLDDEPESLFLYDTIFSRDGYEVICLSCPVLAIERLKTEKVDMVISDYHMPQMNGIEFYNHIRKNKFHEGQFIFVTGSLETKQGILRQEPGVTKVFEKPLSFVDLLKFLNKNIKPRVVGKRVGPK
ncbi:MAG: response regulator [Oligoflexales bacterium]